MTRIFHQEHPDAALARTPVLSKLGLWHTICEACIVNDGFGFFAPRGAGKPQPCSPGKGQRSVRERTPVGDAENGSRFVRGSATSVSVPS